MKNKFKIVFGCFGLISLALILALANARPLTKSCNPFPADTNGNFIISDKEMNQYTIDFKNGLGIDPNYWSWAYKDFKVYNGNYSCNTNDICDTSNVFSCWTWGK